MKYSAIVVYNNQEDSKIPSKYCIKVVCPQLFGYKGLLEKGATEEKIIDNMQMSGWIYPCLQHPMDSFVPELGEWVYIEQINNAAMYAYTGFCSSKDWDNLILKGKPEFEGFNPNFKFEAGVNKSRVFGTRYGSYILIDDTFAEQNFAEGEYKRSGTIVLEAGGKNKKFPDRVGPKIVIDSAEEAEKIDFLVTDKAGEISQIITIDNTKDARTILISCVGEDSKGEKTILLDNKNDLISIVGKDANDSKTQTIKMDLGNTKMSLIDGAEQEITLDYADGSEGVLVKSGANTKISMKKDGSETIVQNGANQKVIMTTSGTKVLHSATVSAELSDSGVVFKNGAIQKIDMGAASIKLTGAAGSVEVM